jgi:hypothetical protein
MKAEQELTDYAKGELAVSILKRIADKRVLYTDMIVRAFWWSDVKLPTMGDIHHYLLIEVSDWAKEKRCSTDMGIGALEIINTFCKETTQVDIQRDLINLSFFQLTNRDDYAWGDADDLKEWQQLLDILNEIYALNLNPSQNVA